MKVNPTKQRKETEILIRVSTEQRRQIKEYADKYKLSQAEAIRLILDEAISEDRNEVQIKESA